MSWLINRYVCLFMRSRWADQANKEDDGRRATHREPHAGEPHGRGLGTRSLMGEPFRLRVARRPSGASPESAHAKQGVKAAGTAIATPGLIAIRSVRGSS